MSEHNHRQGRNKEFQRRRVLQTNDVRTIIAADNGDILFDQESLTIIANKIASLQGSKMRRTDVDSLIEFVRSMRAEEFYTMSLDEARAKIAIMFLRRHASANKYMTAESDHEHQLGLDTITDGPGTLREYQREELQQYTHDENPLKHSWYQDRRGNAFIDRDRVEGKASSPDGIKPGTKITEADVQKAMYEGMGMIKRFLAPDSINEMFNSFRQSWTTLASVVLQHRTVPLDTRNRVPTYNAIGEYRWYIHAAGRPGQIGDLRIQDTLQNAIAMKVCPFWIPVNNVLEDYYGKVRLLIVELQSQSNIVTQFVGAYEDEPIIQYYHFEFEVERRDKNKLYLVPCKNDYIFSSPFARIETITTRFYTPYDIIEFDPDHVVCVVTAALPAQFTSSQPHHLATGDLIYVLNYNSTVPQLNVEVNRPQGYIITKIDNYNFTIEVDTTLAGVDVFDVNCFLGSKRIFLPIEFTSLDK